MITFSSIWESLTRKDTCIFTIKWTDSRGDHSMVGYWYEDHMTSVISWADAHDLEVLLLEVGYVDDCITIKLDSCGEDFEE